MGTQRSLIVHSFPCSITTPLPGLAMMMEGEHTGEEEEEEKAATVEGLTVVGASPHQPDPTIDENRRAPHPQI